MTISTKANCRGIPSGTAIRIGMLALAWGSCNLSAGATPIDRLIWNALRFYKQAEILQDASEAAGLPFSALDFRYDYSRFQNGSTFGLTPGFQGGFSGEDLFYIETPYLIADWEGRGPRSGIGDFMFEYQRVLYADDDGKGLEALAFVMDVIAPTGSVENGVGNGAWIGYPSLTGIYQVSESLTLAPSVAYLHSFGSASIRPLSVGLSQSERVRADFRLAQFSLNVIHNFANEGWALLSPDFTYDLESDRSTLELRAGLGFRLSESATVGLQFSQHVSGPVAAENSLSLNFSYLF